MNGRVAKALRKVAAQATIGKPARCARYIQSCDAAPRSADDIKKGIHKIWHVNDGHGFMNKGTTRGYYRLLKRHYYGRIAVAG